MDSFESGASNLESGILNFESDSMFCLWTAQKPDDTILHGTWCIRPVYSGGCLRNQEVVEYLLLMVQLHRVAIPSVLMKPLLRRRV